LTRQEKKEKEKGKEEELSLAGLPDIMKGTGKKIKTMPSPPSSLSPL